VFCLLPFGELKADDHNDDDMERNGMIVLYGLYYEVEG